MVCCNLGSAATSPVSMLNFWVRSSATNINGESLHRPQESTIRGHHVTIQLSITVRVYGIRNFKIAIYITQSSPGSLPCLKQKQWFNEIILSSVYNEDNLVLRNCWKKLFSEKRLQLWRAKEDCSWAKTIRLRLIAQNYSADFQEQWQFLTGGIYLPLFPSY